MLIDYEKEETNRYMSNSPIYSDLGEINQSSEPKTGLTGAVSTGSSSIWEAGLIDGTGSIKQLRFCDCDQVRIQTIVKRARRRPTGKFSSWKNDRMMHWEWLDERNAFCLLDFRSDVIAYREQPCEIVYFEDGKEVSFYPQIEVLTANRRELWEVRPKRYAQSALVSRREEILSEALVEFGISFRLVIAEELSKQPRQKTMEKILRFGRRAVSTAEHLSVARELSQNGRLTWGDACSGRLGSSGREIVCRLVLEGFLHLDVDSPFGEATEFVPGTRRW